MKRRGLLTILLPLEMAIAMPACSSDSHPLSLRDAAVTVRQDTGTVSTVPEPQADAQSVVQTDGSATIHLGDMPASNPTCAAPVVANCSTTTVRYFFDSSHARCAQTNGCEATGNTFASLTACETTCADLLYCVCRADTSPVCNEPGFCSSCPSLDLLANATDKASGGVCQASGLKCHLTTADSTQWRCNCVAGAGGDLTWACNVVEGG
jgi:hypothetical protein